MTKSYLSRPISGVGIGLRSKHSHRIITEKPDLPWLEVLTDNYFAPGGVTLRELEQARELYPISMHSVGMSLGSADGIDTEYLSKIREMVNRFEPGLVSEHLCWTRKDNHHFHELLPLPYTEEAIEVVSQQIQHVQESIGRQILIENLSSYVTFESSEMTEWEFISSIVQKADCFLLLDVNNVYVSSQNHSFAPEEYLRGIPADRVREIHLGGHEEKENFLLDSHSAPVHDQVWELYREALQICGPVPTLLEWDNDIPELEVLLDEARQADQIWQEFDESNQKPQSAAAGIQ